MFPVSLVHATITVIPSKGFFGDSGRKRSRGTLRRARRAPGVSFQKLPNLLIHNAGHGNAMISAPLPSRLLRLQYGDFDRVQKRGHPPFISPSCSAGGRMVGVGKFEQFDGRAIFDNERDADAVGWTVRRNQDLAASKLRGEIGHFKRDVRNLPDEVRDRCVRFVTHPLHAEFAFVVADDKDFQVFQVGLARLRFSSGNSDVMVAPHCFSLPSEISTNST